MLTVNIPQMEFYNEIEECFTSIKKQTIQMEHSLVSISKWEAKWEKPFLSRDLKTEEEELDYLRCMTITQNVDPLVYSCIPIDEMEKINKYVDSKMTATWFRNEKKGFGRGGEIITSEIIYYWMIKAGIPFECQKWHLNRLLTLIRVCNVKDGPQKKMSTRDIMSRNRALNAARKRSLNTKG